MTMTLHDTPEKELPIGIAPSLVDKYVLEFCNATDLTSSYREVGWIDQDVLERYRYVMRAAMLEAIEQNTNGKIT